MWTDYKDADIHFTIADVRFHTLNFVYERFERSIPSHSHGNGSYEIHYIPRGRGRALINGVSYEITPGTLFVTGPHVEHAQSPFLEDPHVRILHLSESGKKEEERRPVSYGRRGAAFRL